MVERLIYLAYILSFENYRRGHYDGYCKGINDAMDIAAKMAEEFLDNLELSA